MCRGYAHDCGNGERDCCRDEPEEAGGPQGAVRCAHRLTNGPPVRRGCSRELGEGGLRSGERWFCRSSRCGRSWLSSFRAKEKGCRNWQPFSILWIACFFSLPYISRIPESRQNTANFVGAGGLWNQPQHESKGLTKNSTQQRVHSTQCTVRSPQCTGGGNADGELDFELLRGAGWGHGGEVRVFVQFEAEVVPDDAALQVAGGDGEGHGVFSGMEEGGVEHQRALLP